MARGGASYERHARGKRRLGALARQVRSEAADAARVRVDHANGERRACLQAEIRSCSCPEAARDRLTRRPHLLTDD